jgi:dTDP-4-dehydrorhamnose reductase
MIAPRSVVVVGATGQLGRALMRTLAGDKRWEARGLGHEDVEITDPASIARALGSALDRTLGTAPAVVINTAFFAAEDLEPALRVNAAGPRLLAEWCATHDARLVHISTDYVFSGDATEPYRENDRTEPRSVYGISKLAGELLVRAKLPDHLIVRVSSLYDVGGSRQKRNTSFLSTILARARRGETLRVVADQVQSPTYAPDAAATILALLEAGVTGTVHVSNWGWCSWFEFTEAALERSGLRVPLEPIRLADLPPEPPRPRYSVLAHEALRAAGIRSPRPWQEGLAAYLDAAGDA